MRRHLGARRRQRQSDQERGAAAVEFALIFPLVLLLTFGIIEFALLLRDYVGATNAVRDAVRVASAAPRQGNVDGHRGDPPPEGTAPSGAVRSFAYDASQVLNSTGTSLPTRAIRDLWVYRANSQGLPASGNLTVCPADSCVRYAWEDPDGTGPLDGTFDFRSGTWDPASINACPNDANAQAVGVFIRVQHTGLFPSFFDTTFTVSDRAVLKFEPLRPGAGSCKP